MYCDQAHYGAVSGGGAETGATGFQSVVVTEHGGFGGDADNILGGGTDGGGGGDGQGGDGCRLSWWEDNVAKLTLGMEPNNSLAYAPGLEHHHPIMIMFGDPGGWLYR